MNLTNELLLGFDFKQTTLPVVCIDAHGYKLAVGFKSTFYHPTADKGFFLGESHKEGEYVVLELISASGAETYRCQRTIRTPSQLLEAVARANYQHGRQTKLDEFKKFLEA